MRGVLTGFRAFVVRGNLIELAVAFVIGAAFAALVQALVADLVTPLIAALFGEPSFEDLSLTLNGSELLYGEFLNALITFLSVAAAIYFFVVVPYERLQLSQGVEPEMRACEHCLSTIPARAKLCAYCTQPVATGDQTAV
jgi:large conductance mechanosensitive channel